MATRRWLTTYVTALNPITWIATSALATVIIVALAHKIFGLVTWLPENVFRWVGGQGVQLGAAHDEQNTRAGFAAFVSGKSKAHSGMVSDDEKSSSSKKGPAPKAEGEGAKGANQGQGEEGAATGGNKVAGGVEPGPSQAVTLKAGATRFPCGPPPV